MKLVVFSEPLIYVFLSIVILCIGTWLAFLSDSVIPILIVAVPLGILIANVADEELFVGRRWFWLILGVFCCVGVFEFIRGQIAIGTSSVFVIILVSCSLYSRRANYKKRVKK